MVVVGVVSLLIFCWVSLLLFLDKSELLFPHFSLEVGCTFSDTEKRGEVEEEGWVGAKYGKPCSLDEVFFWLRTEGDDWSPL